VIDNNMTYKEKMSGTCARQVSFDIEDGKVYNIKFFGGCSGNTKGVAALCDGMDANEVIRRIKGIRCGFRSTSCPDQLAKAIERNL
jgi:uncharacterized protein (TIGR03905 family)